MAYFGFLAVFLVLPILLLLLLAWRDRRRGLEMPEQFRNLSPGIIIALHVLIALVYTTPWDNYLVATRVWWYDPDLVTGLTIGWVPIEEYTFFVLQPILTGLWLFFWLRRWTPPSEMSSNNGRSRILATALAGLFWLFMVGVLLSGWQPANYLALELAWGLPPILTQLAFGFDMLWRNGRLLLIVLLPAILYYAAADALAIQSGTWTINPDKTLGIYLGGVLPIEEFIFFVLTNVLIVFGSFLAAANESGARFAQMRQWLNRSLQGVQKTEQVN